MNPGMWYRASCLSAATGPGSSPDGSFFGHPEPSVFDLREPGSGSFSV